MKKQLIAVIKRCSVNFAVPFVCIILIHGTLPESEEVVNIVVNVVKQEIREQLYRRLK